MFSHGTPARRQGAGGRGAVAGAVVAAAILSPSAPAHAVPSFARRYDTSCATCHVSFPRLSPFGEAFWRNGYAYPEDDEDLVRDDPVLLGADAYRKLFPEAIWPGTMDYYVPLALVLHSWMTVSHPPGENVGMTFDDLDAMGDVLVAGSLGKNLSFFGKFGIGQSRAFEPQHQRWHVNVRDLWPHSTIRVGKIVPELFRVPRTSCTNCHFAASRPVGVNRWRPFGPDVGVEVAGSIAGRFRYVAGLVEGNGNLRNSAKNYYVRVGGKVGGLRLDGVEEGQRPAKYWVDNAVEFGGFAYYGDSELTATDQSGVTEEFDDRFLSGGLDVNATWGSFTLYGAAIGEWHEQVTLEDREVRVERYFGEARYVVYPWFIPEVSFEYFNSELDTDYQWEGRASIEFLYRANVKLTVDAAMRRPVRAPVRFQEARLLLEMGI